MKHNLPEESKIVAKTLPCRHFFSCAALWWTERWLPAHPWLSACLAAAAISALFLGLLSCIHLNLSITAWPLFG